MSYWKVEKTGEFEAPPGERHGWSIRQNEFTFIRATIYLKQERRAYNATFSVGPDRNSIVLSIRQYMDGRDDDLSEGYIYGQELIYLVGTGIPTPEIMYLVVKKLRNGELKTD